MPKPIKIAPPPAPVAPLDRIKLAADIVGARIIADQAQTAAIIVGVFREPALAVASAIRERSDILQAFLESGADDRDIAPWLPGFRGLIADAEAIAADPVAIQRAHDIAATGRAQPSPLGEVAAA